MITTQRESQRRRPCGQLHDEKNLRSDCQLLFERGQDIVLFIRGDGRIVDANAAAVEAYGYRHHELLSLTLYDLRDDPAAPSVETLMAPENARGLRFESVHRRRDGSTFPVAVSSQAGTLDGERVLMNIIHDISETEQARKALKAEHQFISAVLDTVAALVVVLDREGRIVSFNRACEKLTGYTFKEVQGQPFWDLFLLPEEVPGVRAVFEDLRAGHFPNAHENHWTTRDGDRRLISWSNTALLDDEGAVRHIVASGIDITERRRAERFREEYVSLISHDLRNPLTVIMGQADRLQHLLLTRGLMAEAKGADSVLRSAQRMNGMIQELVESIRLESGQLELNRQAIAPVLLVAEAIEGVGLAPERARIRVEAEEGLPQLMVDQARLERAIVNLLTNALKYSPSESPVTVKLTNADGQVTIRVSDRGLGISPDDLPHLFQRFYRARNAAGADGLGLGLYIVRLIVEAHGGRVWAESEAGQGSAFCMSLPAA